MRLVNPFPYAVDVPALGIENLPAAWPTPELEPSEITESLIEQGWLEAHWETTGEHGPEIVDLPPGAEVINHAVSTNPAEKEAD